MRVECKVLGSLDLIVELAGDRGLEDGKEEEA